MRNAMRRTISHQGGKRGRSGGGDGGEGVPKHIKITSEENEYATSYA